MMAADTSALIAVLTREEGYEIFTNAMKSNVPVLVSTATAVEFLIVALGRGEDAYRAAINMLAGPDIQVVPLDYDQALAAGEANRRYGKGRHPAALNFGDTFAYALASVRNLPLLFKGNDFARTDLTPAV
ncbi:MAG: type II toxin-antitoxin system VapC family toxin [Chloroflexota bacterium]|nr:type II toxin-antitoxin system VapC family toxin [Chloroflexota bacterium]MDE2960960.1 type II toxin-antitoxin system VapC family toxin [Chloroflexota bacterium]